MARTSTRRGADPVGVVRPGLGEQQFDIGGELVHGGSPSLRYLDGLPSLREAYPVPHDDTVAAVTWVRDRAGEFGIDPARITIGRASAGGGGKPAVRELPRRTAQLR